MKELEELPTRKDAVEPSRRFYDVNDKEFKKLIARRINYNMYEVDDVINGMIGVMRDLMRAEKSFNIKDLGKFSTKVHAGRQTKNFDGTTYEVPPTRRIRVVFSKQLRDMIQDDS